MPQALQSILDQVRLTTLVDIGITAVLIYWLFSLIRGTRAVRLVIGVSVLFVVYAAARLFNLPLLRQILETGASSACLPSSWCSSRSSAARSNGSDGSARWPGSSHRPTNGGSSTSPPTSPGRPRSWPPTATAP